MPSDSRAAQPPVCWALGAHPLSLRYLRALHTEATKKTFLRENRLEWQRPCILTETEEYLELMWFECDLLTRLAQNNNLVIFENGCASK